MSTPSSVGHLAADSRDPCSIIHRVTRENRHLWYQLLVIQQPERARACGAGTKANSDRRPVDPPPVVELRIKEGPSFQEGKDITFDYNASFFLYASLEQNRKIALGRMQAQPNPPILTGVPASGMAYLDRPSAAGYFIFPDLSVRHEGQYRLSFSLFETTKEERDFDLEPVDTNLPPGVDWRMDIKTAPFDVFSAKKFPGLMESTQLSKDVAEQGCRVRIRRDVRMRKREGKSGRHSRRDDSAAGDQSAQVPRHRTVTPAAPTPSDDPHARARSMSNSSEHRIPYGVPVAAAPPSGATTPSSVHSHAHLPHDHHRRSSMVDSSGYATPLPPLPPTGPSAQAAYDQQQRHLSFGDQQHQPYAAAPPQQPPAHHHAYAAHQSVGPISPGGPYTPTASSYPPPPTSQHSSAYPPPIVADAPGSRRASSAYMPPSPSVYSTDGAHAHTHSHGRMDSYSSAPGIHPAAAAPRMHSSSMSSNGSVSSAMVPQHHAPPPPPQQQQLAPLKIQHLVSPLPAIEPQTEPVEEPQPIPTGGKRKHDVVFHQSMQPLHNRQRQRDPHHGGRMRGLTPDPLEGAYTRADGTVGVISFNSYST